MFISELSVTGGDNGAAFGGANVTLNCTEANAVTPDGVYTWYLANSVISGATTQTYEINPDSQTKAGEYKCEATFNTTVEQSSNVTFNIYGKKCSFRK